MNGIIMSANLSDEKTKVVHALISKAIFENIKEITDKESLVKSLYIEIAQKRTDFACKSLARISLLQQHPQKRNKQQQEEEELEQYLLQTSEQKCNLEEIEITKLKSRLKNLIGLLKNEIVKSLDHKKPWDITFTSKCSEGNCHRSGQLSRCFQCDQCEQALCWEHFSNTSLFCEHCIENNEIPGCGNMDSCPGLYIQCCDMKSLSFDEEDPLDD
eukprot:Pgem_evm1s18695